MRRCVLREDVPNHRYEQDETDQQAPLPAPASEFAYMRAVGAHVGREQCPDEREVDRQVEVVMKSDTLEKTNGTKNAATAPPANQRS